ncbi:MAG: DUF1073 domain-containing protein [Endomicrobium sp.]|jgi:phage-related protein (TIGR01555 family)|nr:DUF1073 domain-containing protein [Endomicrobium sp.]
MTNKNNNEKIETRENGLKNVANNFINNANSVHSLAAQYDFARFELYTLQRMLLTQNYATNGIFRKIIDTKINDALRGQAVIKSTQLSEDDIDELNDYLQRHNIVEIVKQTHYLNRLYGGAGIIIEVVGDKFEDELFIRNIKKGTQINFYAVDRWEIPTTLTMVNDQIDNKYYLADSEYFYYYGHKIHASRIILLKGIYSPMLVRQRLQGWGLSIVEPLIEPTNSYNLGVKVLYELLSESKIDIVKLDGLNDYLINNETFVYDKITLLSQIKNYKSVLGLDSKDDFATKQINFSGIPDLIRELKYEICANTDDYPLSKIWGVQSSGFSSGQDDLIKYNASVMSETRPKCISTFKQVLKIISKALFGFIPNDYDVEFDELTLFNQEQIEIKKQNEFVRLKTLYDSKLLTSGELGRQLESKQILIADTKMSRGELPEFNEMQTQEKEIDLNATGLDI